MYALIFTNSVFIFYLSYILLEQGKRSLRSRDFWFALAGLLLSLYIAGHFISLEVPGVSFPGISMP
jgi:hypothetical protein